MQKQSNHEQSSEDVSKKKISELEKVVAEMMKHPLTYDEAREQVKRLRGENWKNGEKTKRKKLK